jgi:hypothetical protein
MAAAPTVSTVRATLGDVLLPPEMDGAPPTLARAAKYLHIIYEIGFCHIMRPYIVQSAAKEHNFLRTEDGETALSLPLSAVTTSKHPIMEIKGKIIAVLPAQSGVSARTGNPWMKQEYVMESQDNKFPRKICFQIFGEERIAQAAIQQGEELTVHIDIDSQEYQGRWFTRINAWKVERGSAVSIPTEQRQGSAPAEVPTVAYAAAADTDEDGLPF